MDTEESNSERLDEKSFHEENNQKVANESNTSSTSFAMRMAVKSIKAKFYSVPCISTDLLQVSQKVI